MVTKNTKKNICMVAFTAYSTDNRVRREAEALASFGGYNVLVLALKEGVYPRSFHLHGVQIREMNISKYQGKSNLRYLMSYLKFALSVFFACNRLLMNNSLDIVHIHNMPNFLVFCAIIPFLFGRKVILDVHDTMLETYLAKFEGHLNNLFTWALRLEELSSCMFAHKIICVNHIQRKTLLKRGIPESKLFILLNTPDPRIFRPGKKSVINRSNNKRFRIVYHGTVTKRLSLDLAIRAVASLVGRIPFLEFTILGRGEEIQELAQLSRELGVQEIVHFESQVPGEELADILTRMDLGIVPNSRNIATELMLPVKMLECVALDIPVVVPRLKTIEYYFSDDMVTYFEPGNVDSLISSILEAFNSENERINKAKNAKRFLEKYGWDTHKFTLINLYRSLP
jgi:glycosyltransferase involved in cell wall biosynthesis